MRRLRTVHGLLQEANGLGLLADPLMEKATAEIVSGSRPRFDIQRDIKQKERARDMLVKKYKTSSLPEVSSPGGASCILAVSSCDLHLVTKSTQHLQCEDPAPGALLSLRLALLSVEFLHCMRCLFLSALSSALCCAGGHLAVSLLPLGQ